MDVCAPAQSPEENIKCPSLSLPILFPGAPLAAVNANEAPTSTCPSAGFIGKSAAKSSFLHGY